MIFLKLTVNVIKNKVHKNDLYQVKCIKIDKYFFYESGIEIKTNNLIKP